MTNTIDAARSVVTPPADTATDQPRQRPTRPADQRGTRSRLGRHTSPTRTALAEITLTHGQLEVVVARLALMAARPDFGSSRVDILDAAHQAQRALLSVRHARSHMDATTLSHPDGADHSDGAKPSHWFG